MVARLSDRNINFLNKYGLLNFVVTDNMHTWFFNHIDPAITFPQFSFITDNNQEKFTQTIYEDKDFECQVEYDRKVQIFRIKKMRHNNSIENIILILEQFTLHKNLICCLYQAIQELNHFYKGGENHIEILHMTYQKLVIKINGELLVTFFTRYSINDIVKVLIYPSIASLNDYLAMKFARALKNRPQELHVVK